MYGQVRIPLRDRLSYFLAYLTPLTFLKSCLYDVIQINLRLLLFPLLKNYLPSVTLGDIVLFTDDTFHLLGKDGISALTLPFCSCLVGFMKID